MHLASAGAATAAQVCRSCAALLLLRKKVNVPSVPVFFEVRTAGIVYGQKSLSSGGPLFLWHPRAEVTIIGIFVRSL